jgi:hypothetical protein
MHACGNRDCQGRKTGLAIRACVERPWQIDLEETTEREEIYTALADLAFSRSSIENMPESVGQIRSR